MYFLIECFSVFDKECLRKITNPIAMNFSSIQIVVSTKHSPVGEMVDFKSGAEKVDELGISYTKKCGCYAIKYCEDPEATMNRLLHTKDRRV